jgi:tetratricopeptide (TPR) repeat protein
MISKVQVNAGAALSTRFQSLDALDHGRYDEAIALYEHLDGCAAGDPEAALWGAEVAMYLYHLDEAAEGLARAGDLDALASDTDGLGHLARRWALLSCELAQLKGEPEAAKIGLETLVERASDAGDTVMETRARVTLARFARFQGDWSLALARAAEAARLARILRNPFFAGCALSNRGIALYELGSTAEAEVALREAVALLTETENLRFRALAQNALAGLLVATDRQEEACALLEVAESTVLGIGVVNDVQIIRHATAWAMFCAGRYREARLRASSLLEMDRAGRDSRAELFGLKLLACLACADDRAEDAVGIAEELARLADVAGSEADALEARMLLARARAKAGRQGALADLINLQDEVDRFGLGSYRVLARLFLADACGQKDPISFHRYWSDARERACGERSAWVRAELAAIERACGRYPVRIEGDHLVIDMTGPLPSRDAVHKVVDQMLIAEALKREEGSYAKAGRLIGEQRWNMRHLAHQLSVVSPVHPKVDG